MPAQALTEHLGAPMGAEFRLTRNLLGDRATELLRDAIVRGQIKPGDKLREHRVAESLGVSRAPARDALIRLEKEGLVVSRSTGRYVVDLDERDVRELYQVRLALETKAVELATQHACPLNAAALEAKVQEMGAAVADHDSVVFARNDIETHRLLWSQAENRHLYTILSSMAGLMFMFIARHAENYDWDETLQYHRDLVACVSSGDVDAACRSIARHIEQAYSRSLRLLQQESRYAAEVAPMRALRTAEGPDLRA